MGQRSGMSPERGTQFSHDSPDQMNQASMFPKPRRRENSRRPSSPLVSRLGQGRLGGVRTTLRPHCAQAPPRSRGSGPGTEFAFGHELEHRGVVVAALEPVAYLGQPVGVAGDDLFEPAHLGRDDPTVGIEDGARAGAPRLLALLPLLSVAASFDGALLSCVVRKNRLPGSPSESVLRSRVSSSSNTCSSASSAGQTRSLSTA